MIEECRMDRYTEVCRPRLDDLEQWQARQNGSLQRIEGKVEEFQTKLDRLFFAVLALAVSVVGALIVYLVQST